MAGGFAGKVALVTGAGSGIGRASALAFAREGASVMVSDSLADRCDAVVGTITAAGGTAKAFRCDVRDRGEIAALMTETISVFGGIDHAYNNAGVGGPIANFADYPEESWDQIIQTNLTSIFLCMKHEINHMLERGGGTIVNCSSASGITGNSGMSAYSASKFGIIGLTKTAAKEYAAQGIRVNAVCPGTIHTPAVDAFLEGEPEVAEPFLAAKKAQQPIGRLGTPDEVAQAVLWLSGPGASFAIGHCLVVDGGRTA